MGMDSSQCTPSSTIARAYVRALEVSSTGKVIDISAEVPPVSYQRNL